MAPWNAQKIIDDIDSYKEFFNSPHFSWKYFVVKLAAYQIRIISEVERQRLVLEELAKDKEN